MKKYPEYTAEELNRIPWRPNRMNLSNYLDHNCECANCLGIHNLSEFDVSLEGSKMRLIVECPECRKKSIIKVKGFFSTKLITIASLPELEGETFPTCKYCGQETSMAGNLTNMILSEIEDPGEFNSKYGMRCTEHSSGLTRELMKEKNISKNEFEEAHKKALKIMADKVELMKFK